MRKILEKEFLARRISKLLTMTIAKNEFSNTFVQRHLSSEAATESTSVQNSAVSQQRAQEETKEAAAASSSTDAENISNVVVQKQKIVLSKDAERRKPKMKVV